MSNTSQRSYSKNKTLLNYSKQKKNSSQSLSSTNKTIKAQNQFLFLQNSSLIKPKLQKKSTSQQISIQTKVYQNKVSQDGSFENKKIDNQNLEKSTIQVSKLDSQIQTTSQKTETQQNKVKNINVINSVITTVKSLMENYFVEILKKTNQNHNKKYEQLKTLYYELQEKYLNEKLQSLFYKDMDKDKKVEIEQLENSITKLQQTKNKILQDLKTERNSRLQVNSQCLKLKYEKASLLKSSENKQNIIKQKNNKIKEKQEQLQKQSQDFNKILKQVQQKNSNQLENQKQQFQMKLSKLKEKSYKLNEENAILVNDLNQKTKDIIQKEQIIRQLKQNLNWCNDKLEQSNNRKKQLNMLIQDEKKYIRRVKQTLNYQYVPRDFQIYSLEDITESEIKQFQVKDNYKFVKQAIELSNIFANVKCSEVIFSLCNHLFGLKKQMKQGAKQKLKQDLIQLQFLFFEKANYSIINKKIENLLNNYLKIKLQNKFQIKIFQSFQKIPAHVQLLNQKIIQLQQLLDSKTDQYQNKNQLNKAKYENLEDQKLKAINQRNKLISQKQNNIVELKQQMSIKMLQFLKVKQQFLTQQNQYKQKLKNLQLELQKSVQQIQALQLSKNKKLQEKNNEFQKYKQRSQKNILNLKEALQKNQIKSNEAISILQNKLFIYELQVNKLKIDNTEKEQQVMKTKRQKQKLIYDNTMRFNQQIKKKQLQIYQIKKQKQLLSDKIIELQKTNRLFKIQLQDYKIKYSQEKDKKPSQKQQQLIIQTPTNINEAINKAKFQFASQIIGPKDIAFIIDSVTKFTSKKIINSNLVFKWDQKANTDFAKVLKQLKTFVIILKCNQNNFNFGFYVDQITQQKAPQNPKAFLFSITKQKCFYRAENANQLVKNCWSAFGMLVVYFGNKEIRLKNKEPIIRLQFVGTKCFNISNRMQLFGTTKDEFIFNEMEIHALSLQ